MAERCSEPAPSFPTSSLVLDTGATRTLRVLNADPERSALAYLAATSDLEPSQHGVEDDGTIRLEGLRPDVRYNLYIREWDTARCALLRDLPAGEPWPEIELGQGADVTGRVLLPEAHDGASVAVMVDRAVLIDGLVEEDGTFRIQAVPPGRWTVVAYTTVGEDYRAATAETEAGAPVSLDLRR